MKRVVKESTFELNIADTTRVIEFRVYVEEIDTFKTPLYFVQLEPSKIIVRDKKVPLSIGYQTERDALARMYGFIEDINDGVYKLDLDENFQLVLSASD